MMSLSMDWRVPGTQGSSFHSDFNAMLYANCGTPASSRQPQRRSEPRQRRVNLSHCPRWMLDGSQRCWRWCCNRHGQHSAGRKTVFVLLRSRHVLAWIWAELMRPPQLNDWAETGVDISSRAPPAAPPLPTPTPRVKSAARAKEPGNTRARETWRPAHIP